MNRQSSLRRVSGPWTEYSGRYEHEGRTYDWNCWATAPVFQVRLIGHGLPDVGIGMAVWTTSEAHFLVGAISLPPTMRGIQIGTGSPMTTAGMRLNAAASVFPNQG